MCQIIYIQALLTKLPSIHFTLKEMRAESLTDLDG